MQEFDSFIKILNAGGVVAVLVVVVYLLLTGRFVTGREYQNLLDLFKAQAAEILSMRDEMGRLKERDDSQQKTIDQQAAVIADQRKRIDQLEAERDDLRKQLGLGAPKVMT